MINIADLRVRWLAFQQASGPSRILRGMSITTVCVLLGMPVAQAAVVDFEGLYDGEIVTTQYTNLSFQNTLVLTAGLSLNEFELPPVSGTNVVVDDGGQIQINFLTPVSSVGGYFSYSTGLNFLAFDSVGVQIAAVNSAFNSNLNLSGDVGSMPNEFLEVASGGGIASVSIRGNPAGGSFVLDNLTYTPVPVPAAIWLLGSGLLGIIGIARQRKFNHRGVLEP